jgi:hypothetical protein
MKRKLLFGSAFLFIMFSVTSCEKLGGCKVCQDVRYEAGAVIGATAETEFCGTQLIQKEATPDLTIGSITTKVECR